MKYSLAITKRTLKEYLNILPISYYLKTKIDYDVSDASSSYFDFNEHKIMISVKQLNGLIYDHKPTDKEVEKDVRCVLYHEVSHAILTPNEKIIIRQDIFNVFEDERIETLLSEFFLNVDFKRFVKKINNFNESMVPDTLYKFFYFLVRFRIGPEELIKEVNEIIYKARFITSKYTVHHIDGMKGIAYSFNHYQTDIYKLFDKCRKYFHLPENHSKPNPKSDESNESNNTYIAKSPSASKLEEELKEKEKEIDDSKDSYFQKPINEIDFHSRLRKIEPDATSLEEMCIRNKIDKELYSNELLRYIKFTVKAGKEPGDPKFKAALKPIILRYKGSMKQNGGSRTSYSGRINPRLTINKDFKWFIRSGGNSIKRGIKLQLNLFIDRSNSFANNENNVNNILYELDNLEKEISNVFEYNLITMGHSIDVCEKNARRLQCHHGTDLRRDWKKTIDKMQNPNNDCINIVLFDGQVYDKKTKPLFKMFDKNGFIIISDEANAPAIKQYCKNIRKAIIVKSENEYIKNLGDNIIKVLNMCIR